MPDHGASDRRRAEITRAFADRRSIDWPALLERASGPADRAACDTLRRLDALRGDPRLDPEPEPVHPWTAILRIMVVLGAIQLLLALGRFGAALAAGTAPVDLAPRAAFGALLGSACLLLAPAMQRDHRVFFLLATFILTGSAFVHPLWLVLESADSSAANIVFRGLYPDAFAPAALWQFVAVFPAVKRFTAFDLFARRAASIVAALGAGLFLANLLLTHGVVPQSIAIVARDDPQSLFWHAFAWATFPALGAIIVRAHRARWNERVKAVRFAWAVGAGAAPVLTMGVADSLPGVTPWLAATGIRPWVDLFVLSSLAAMPMLAAVGVLVDEPFERRRAVRPLRPRRRRERLSAALDRVRLARGSREIAAVLRQELQAFFGGGRALVIRAGDLPAGTALLPILEASSGPIDLSRSGEPFVLLPRHDREWLDARSVGLAAAVRLRDATIPAVVLIGPPRATDAFTRADHWFIRTLLIAAAAAWQVADATKADEECADECTRCGRVRPAASPPCCARAETRLAALPHRFGDRFIVIRRLGAGGMGIVYLGQDLLLGRDVALKTWSGLREETMTRLRDEARVMAGLNHDALATIYGLERWRRTPVLIVEYCAHGTLADVISRAPLSPDDTLRLGIRLTQGLSYMHHRGVFHRDIKPSNIGFTADDAAKLLDFGLAGMDDTGGGTPAYLPPEVRRGEPLDAVSDLWALATVLHEASGGGGMLDEFFRRALAARPGDRFQSSLEMHEALVELTRSRGRT